MHHINAYTKIIVFNQIHPQLRNLVFFLLKIVIFIRRFYFLFIQKVKPIRSIILQSLIVIESIQLMVFDVYYGFY